MNEIQKRNLMQLIIKDQPDQITSAIKSSVYAKRVYGIEINWHDWSSILDQMVTIGEITRHKHNPDGLSLYMVTNKEQ